MLQGRYSASSIIRNFAHFSPWFSASAISSLSWEKVATDLRDYLPRNQALLKLFLPPLSACKFNSPILILLNWAPKVTFMSIKNNDFSWLKKVHNNLGRGCPPMAYAIGGHFSVEHPFIVEFGPHLVLFLLPIPQVPGGKLCLPHMCYQRSKHFMKLWKILIYSFWVRT